MKKIILLLSVIVFMGAGCMQSNPPPTSTDLNSPTTTVGTSSQQTSISSIVSNVTSTSPTSQKNQYTPQPLSTASDGRKILIPGNYDHMPEVCQAIFNMDPANTSVAYSSKEYGISFKVPFNKKWGNKEYAISSYDEMIEDGAKLMFGNIDVGFEGGCGVGRAVSMRFTLPQTVEAMIADSETDESAKNFLHKKINGLNVLIYQTGNDYCGKEGYDSHLIIAGKKYNYWFYLPCEKNIQNIEKIIQTAKLIE